LMRAVNPKVNVNALSQHGVIGQVGVLYTNICGVLTLTAVAGTTAAATPATFLANKAIIAPNYAIRRALASKLRKVPMRLQLLPYVVSQVTYHYQMS